MDKEDARGDGRQSPGGCSNAVAQHREIALQTRTPEVLIQQIRESPRLILEQVRPRCANRLGHTRGDRAEARPLELFQHRIEQPAIARPLSHTKRWDESVYAVDQAF